jgi:hypothetical protein
VVAAEIEGQLVVYDPATRGAARLNLVAAAIWAALDGFGALADLADDVAGAFGIKPDVAFVGVVDLIESLDRADLLIPDEHTA